MKKLIYFLSSTLILSVVVSSCTKVDLPYETFEDMQYGAFARLLNQSGAFDFFDPANSGITTTVEFYDENQGKNVANYSWTVSFQDNSPGYGSGDVAAVPLVSYDASQFSPAPDSGYPSLTFKLGFQDALDALGLTINDVTGGDIFKFEATITKTDGSTFAAGNTGSNIFSSATFAGLFAINGTIVCLPTPGYFTGNYSLEQTAGADYAWAPGTPHFATEIVPVDDPSPTIRDIGVTYLPGIGGFELTLSIELVCGEIMVYTNTGLGCTSQDIIWIQDDPPATYDPNDDSVMIIKLIDDSESSCGTVLNGPIELTLTKQ